MAIALKMRFKFQVSGFRFQVSSVQSSWTSQEAKSSARFKAYIIFLMKCCTNQALAYEHLLEGKKGAVLRISYCENFEKREKLGKLLTSHRLHGYHGFIFNHELLELRSTAVGNCKSLALQRKSKVNCWLEYG